MIENPTLDDKKYYLEDLQAPEAFYNDVEDVDERPRLETEDGWTFILIRIPISNPDDDSNPYTTVPYGIIFKENIIITLCFFKNQMTPDFVNYVNRKSIQINSVIDLMLRLHISSSIWFLKYLKQIQQKIKLAESSLEKSVTNEDLQTLFNLEKALVYFSTSLKGNDILLYKIRKLETPQNPFDSDLMEDVEIENRQAIETTKIFSDILSGMMDAYASVISNNLNIIMKRLTSISIILMIPTLIASFYGMNVPNFMENDRFSFILIALVSLLISTTSALLFLRKRWI